MELLNKLTQTFGVSGNEEKICEILKDELKDCGELTISPLGNLTLHISGKGEKVMFAAHMDEIGIMVTYIEDNGFLRFTAVGGVRAANALGSRVKFQNGTEGIVCLGDKKELKDLKISEMFIDICAKDREEAEKQVQIGDCAMFEGDFIKRGDYITSKALDDRAGCYILAEAAKKIKNPKKDIYMVFTVQEELGLRGGKTAAYDINPDYAIAIDVTACGDTPDGYNMAVKTGEGIGIKVRDNSIIAHPKVRDMIEKASAKHQFEVLEFGGTDAGAFQTSGGGIASGGISIPVRYVHSVNETASVKDIEEAIDTVVKICETE